MGIGHSKKLTGADGSGAISIVKSKLGQKQRPAFNLVNHAVFIIDAPRPESRQGMLERLGLPDPGEGFPFDFSDQLVNPLDHPLVVLLPVQVVIPGFVSKDQLHFASFRSTPLPATSCAAAESKRLAFVGLRNRYAVSSSA